MAACSFLFLEKGRNILVRITMHTTLLFKFKCSQTSLPAQLAVQSLSISPVESKAKGPSIVCDRQSTMSCTMSRSFLPKLEVILGGLQNVRWATRHQMTRMIVAVDVF